MEIHAGPFGGWDFGKCRARIFGTGRAPISYISAVDVAAFAVESVFNPRGANRALHAGRARTTGEASSFEEALRLFETRDGYSFKDFFGCVDPITLLALARTAYVLNRLDHSRTLLDRARAAGSREEFGFTLL